MCRANACPRTTLPVPVLWKRLAAPLWVFNFGIKCPGFGTGTMSLRLFLVVLPLVVPSHLDRLELAFVRFGRIVAETIQLDDPFVKVGEAQFERVLGGELFEKRQGDIF